MTDEELEKRLSGAFNFSDDEYEKVKSYLNNDKTNNPNNEWENDKANTSNKKWKYTYSTIQTPQGETVTTTEIEPSVKPFGSNYYVLKRRQPTGFEKAIGLDKYPIAEEIDSDKYKDWWKRRIVLGQNESGVFEPRDFESAHPDFDIGEYLRQAVAAKDEGDYTLQQEGVFDKINKFFTAPLDEAKATEQAYASNAFDNKIQNLIDDIVIYNSFQKQLSEANASNTMPKIRGDKGLLDNSLYANQFRRLLNGSGYKGPEHRTWDDPYNPVYDTLSDIGKNDRKAVEKDVYRMLSEISKYK